MRFLNILGYLAIPLAYLVHFWLGRGHSWEPQTTFVLAALGVIPLAHLMGIATEQLAERTGPTWGGLMNATFGNAAELIIALIALSKGLNDMVMATFTGSILGNLLLVAGGAMVVGGWKREKQEFSRASAELNAGLLMLSVAALLAPAMFHYTAEHMHDVHILQHEHRVSIGTSVILLIVYGLGLLFTLRTHAHIFSTGPATSDEDRRGMGEAWSVSKSVMMLLIASAGIAVVAELLVGSAETMAQDLGWSRIFIGVILLAIIGNAAEHSTAMLLAHRNDMDTAMTICFQSSLQIALFVTPICVLISMLFPLLGFEHARYASLVFSPMEVVAVMMTVFVVVIVSLNGQSNWFEGVLLLGLYAILGIAFFYIPVPGQGAVRMTTMP